MADDEGRIDSLALILYRLDQIESALENSRRTYRQITAGVVVALALPIIQTINLVTDARGS